MFWFVEQVEDVDYGRLLSHLIGELISICSDTLLARNQCDSLSQGKPVYAPALSCVTRFPGRGISTVLVSQFLQMDLARRL